VQTDVVIPRLAKTDAEIFADESIGTGNQDIHGVRTVRTAGLSG
jgi:hypothetical protein